MIPKWETWHNIILTPEQIKTSVGDRLLSCHTTERKSKQKQAALESAGGIAKNGDGEVQKMVMEEVQEMISTHQMKINFHHLKMAP